MQKECPTMMTEALCTSVQLYFLFFAVSGSEVCSSSVKGDYQLSVLTVQQL